MDNPQIKKLKLKIHGMHCASCEVLVERKIKNIAGIEKVHVSHVSGKAEIVCKEEPNLRQLNNLLKPDGYSVSLWENRHSALSAAHQNTAIDYMQMGWMFLVVVVAYYILKQFNFLPNFGISEHMSYSLIFLIGLVAAVSSCIAVVGGLLVAMSGTYREAHPEMSGAEKFRPHIYFNIGRIIGYTVFGAAVGALGSVLTLSPRANGYLVVLVGVIMLMLGFQLLHLFPTLRRFSPKMPKFISHKIHDLSTKDTKSAPLVLGGLTFFLPCGFTQALQLYVLATGDWQVGALTMLTFSLGTLPALLSLSAVSSFAKGMFQKQFLRFAGVVIVLLAVFNINNGLTLAGYNLNFVTAAVDARVQIVDGKQIVKMTVNGYNYLPHTFTVVEGVPVEWQIDGRNAAGCGRVIVMPTMGISKYLSSDDITTLAFTPTGTGSIPFNCSMGMMTRGSQFNLIPNTTGIIGATVNPSGQSAICDPTISSCPEK